MLFSEKFVFIHIDKSAGTSIQRALQPHANPVVNSRIRRRLVWLGKTNRLGLHRLVEFPEHVTAQVVKSCLPPAVYGRLFKFAFVRNPWDRLVSRYAQLLRNPKEPARHSGRAEAGFEEFVRWEIQRNKSHQYTYVCDAKGNLIVDFIGHFERLEEEFTRICEHLGISATLTKTNTSKHDSYVKYYTPATRQLVAEHYRRDIELFGYEFDGVVPRASRV
ncbi:MAG: sulfotransferase family 2 domain-containing protein [Verrucomicrobiae bacterium]|nr:sulfotransferase family 2 domain-containing protein [Verrucomicrobiae bacterium]